MSSTESTLAPAAVPTPTIWADLRAALRGTGADYLPMLGSSNRQLNEIDFQRRTGGGK